MSTGAHSAHRSRFGGRRRRKTLLREERRRSLMREAEQASFQATFSGFAAVVAEQRHDSARADAYREQAAVSRRTAARLRLAAERCRPWWSRPRAAAREWSHDVRIRLSAPWSRRGTNSEPRRTR